MKELTKDYRQTIIKRLKSDPAFLKAMLQEAITAMKEGDDVSAMTIIRDVIHSHLL